MLNKSLNPTPTDIETTSINTFPSKITTNTFEGTESGNCVSWGGLVSNLNCPKQFPFCNCEKKTLEIIPDNPEPTDSDLYEALKNTKECNKIAQVFKTNDRFLKFFGYDYSNPTSSYNCSCEEYYGEKNTFSIYSEFSEQSALYYGATAGFTFSRDSNYNNGGYYPYARRKNYAFGLTLYAFPPEIKAKEAPQYKTTKNCQNQKIIGEYFPAYLEYSKTNATFWNTPPETPLLRRAQANLLHCQRIKILVNGSFDVKPGNILTISYPTAENKNIKSSRFSGNWMVYKVKRVITHQKHSMYLFLMRDGLGQDPNTNYSQIIYTKET